MRAKGFFGFIVIIALLALPVMAHAQASANIAEVNIKGAPITLYGGAIAASVTLANATVIDMSNYVGGSIEMVVNSGTGTWSLAFYTKEANSGTYVAPKILANDYGSYTSYPSITTTASTSGSWFIRGIEAKYLKIVPTLTPPCNATFKFTPSKR